MTHDEILSVHADRYARMTPQERGCMLKEPIMEPTKVCPIVLRVRTTPQILVFRHPLAGIQLVKGTIEPGEKLADAVLRELREESGIENAMIRQDLGVWDAGFETQIWSVQLCATSEELPDSWNHQCADDGGLDLSFFWHDLDSEPSQEWHPLFRHAIEFVRQALPKGSHDRRGGFVLRGNQANRREPHAQMERISGSAVFCFRRLVTPRVFWESITTDQPRPSTSGAKQHAD